MKKILFFFVLFAVKSFAALDIQNAGVSNITRISATYYGTLVSTNGSGTNPTVTLYYGTSDSGTNATNWVYSCLFSNVAVGSFSTNMSGLTPAKYYYCRPLANEGASNAWASSSTSFWTTAGAPTNPYPAATGGVFLVVSTNGEFLGPTKAKVIAANDLATGSQISNLTATWSAYPATTDVNISTNAIIFGGVTRTNWPEHGTGDVSTWSFYPATQTVDIAYQGIKFGGVTRTNWPVDATEVAASNAALGIRVGVLEVGVSNLQISTTNNLGTNWSRYPATQTVDIAGQGIKFGGVIRTNWPSVDASEWHLYAAGQDVDIANYSLYNVGWIELGGVWRSSWPEPSSNWASMSASTNVNLAGHTISNGTFIGTIPALTNYSTNIHFHADYLTNAASWSSQPATQTVNMANRGLANVSSIGLGGVTRTNWWPEGALIFSRLSVGPTNMDSPQLLNMAGTNGEVFFNQSVYGTLVSGCATQYPTIVEEMELTNTNLHGWTNLAYIIDGPTTNSADGVDVGTKLSKPIRFAGWESNMPNNAVVKGVIVHVQVSSRDGETHSAWLVQDGVTSSVRTVVSSLGDQTCSFGASNSTWGFTNITSGFLLDFKMGNHLYTFGHSVSRCWVEIYFTAGITSWLTGVDSNGHYSVLSGSYIPEKKVGIASNQITFSIPLSVPSITLGTNTVVSNWPSASSGITNETDPVYTASVAAAISADDTQKWHQAAADASQATNAINTISNRVDVIETNYLVKATNAPASGYALYASVGGGVTNYYWGPVSTNGSSGGVTNQIMDVNGILYTITNAPLTNGYVLAFNPANTTAFFTTNFDGTGGGVGSTYTADGLTLTLNGSQFSVSQWIPNNLIELRFELWNHETTYSMGLLDGPGYWFSDEGGIVIGSSSNYIFDSPGYIHDPGSTNINALLFTAEGQYSNAVPAIPLKGTNLTFAAWVYLPDASRKGAALMWSSSDANGFGLCVGDANGEAAGNHLVGWYIGITWINTAIHIGTGWHLIGWSLDQTDVNKGYAWLDGTNVYTNANTLAVPAASTLCVGGVVIGGPQDIRFNGAVDEPMVFNRVLTSGEWQTLYANGAGVYGDISAGLWKTGLLWAAHMDEGSGTTVADFSTNAITLNKYGTVAWTNSAVCVNPGFISPGDLCLVSTNMVLPFVPGYGYVSALINVGAETITTNDIKLYMSRDYGTNWAGATLTISGTWDASNKLFAGTAIMTNQPVGTNAMIKLTSNSNKVITVLGVAGPCSAE